MRVSRGKDKVTYLFNGDLQEEIEKAKAELVKKTCAPLYNHLKWQKEKADKELAAYERRLADLRGFIKAAEDEEKKEQEGGSV